MTIYPEICLSRLIALLIDLFLINLFFRTFSLTLKLCFVKKILSFPRFSPVRLPRASNTQTHVLRRFTIKQLVLNGSDDQKQCLLSNSSINLALLYLYRKGSIVVKHFTNKKMLNKICFALVFSFSWEDYFG